MERAIDLARRARRGDRTALEALLRECAGVADAIARAQLGDTHAAETAAADALTRLARGIDQLDDPTRIAAWFRRIVVRAAANVRRNEQVRAPAAPVDAPSSVRGPVDTLIAVERVAALDAAVAALDPRLREPLLLHVAEGLSYRDVAAILDVGLATVSRRIDRARAILRATFRGDDR